MEFVTFTNTNSYTVFIGNILVPAGETRLVDKRLISLKKDVEKTCSNSIDPLQELLKKPVAAVLDALPELTHEEISRLGELEQAGHARKGILGVIAELLLKTSSDSLGGGLGDGNESSQ